MTNLKPLVLPKEIWIARAKSHMALVGPMADAFIKRRSLGLSHPVHDFLFTYYSCSPQKLREWVPSFEECLEITPETVEECPYLSGYWFCSDEKILSCNKERIQDKTRQLASFVADLCRNILKRTPRFHCFGMHEWAMVYKIPKEDVRHKGYKLRLTSDALAAFVESQTICCSHYDAFRFFTDGAIPLNILNPTIETRLQMEQGGCLHANMDLYKWAIKLWPWVGSDFIAKAFFLALEGRELDMRASPYDFTEMGYSPLCIETEEGRQQYQIEQQNLTERATPLRKELEAICRRLAAL